MSLSQKELQKRLKAIRFASEVGKTLDGSMVRLVYAATAVPTERAIREADPAISAKANPNEYVGYADRMFKSQAGNTFLVMRVLNRKDEKKPEQIGAYRSFNVSSGAIEELEVLS